MDVAVQGYLNVGPLKEILILNLCDGELRRWEWISSDEFLAVFTEKQVRGWHRWLHGPL